jgi:outer membrane protein OmpA-like peptidoglycan-associated protein/Tol biopolymer transport system component
MNSKLILLFLFSSGFSLSVVAQVTYKDNAKGKAKEYYEKADFDVAYGKYEQAEEAARLAIADKDNFIDAWILVGQLNAQAFKKWEKAADAYERVKLLNEGYMGDVNFQLGICYINLSKYGRAKSAFQSFLSQQKIAAEQRLLAEKMVKDCDFAEEAMRNPVPFTPINLGEGVNTPDDESMPSLTADGKYLYFTRHYGSGKYQDEDIFMSLNTTAGFAPATSISEAINTERFIEGAQSVSPNGKYLFFTSADRPDGFGRADIYMSRKVGDLWERANNMGKMINTPGYETQPCISADGRSLYFSAIRAKGEGGCDIWVSQLSDDGTWSEPKNLGRNINTQYDEMRPYIHPDGQTLYFSSRGHAGMGNFDLYMSRLQQDGSWGVPVNLGYPINTAGDELGIYVTADGATAYFASEQADSKGQMDIYKFEMPNASRPAFTSYIKGNVYDAETREALYANVQVYDLATGKLYASLSGDKLNGVFLSTLPAGKMYAVQVQKDGYLFYSKYISLSELEEGKPFEIAIPLNKIKVGEKIVLNNIFFNSEEFALREESTFELNNVIKLLEKNPSLKIEIGGHTDNSGSEESNRKLSENRAKSVYDYLVGKGVEEGRLTYRGYASSKSVSDNNSPAGKAKNRRTELTVIAI